MKYYSTLGYPLMRALVNAVVNLRVLAPRSYLLTTSTYSLVDANNITSR